MAWKSYLSSFTKENGDYTDEIFEIYFGKKELKVSPKRWQQEIAKAYMYVVECADGTLYTELHHRCRTSPQTHNRQLPVCQKSPPVKLLYSESLR